MNTKTNDVRYINANVLLEHVKDLPTWSDAEGMEDKPMKYPEGMFDCDDVINSINNAPTADVVSKAEIAKIFEDIRRIVKLLRYDADYTVFDMSRDVAELQKKYAEEKG